MIILCIDNDPEDIDFLADAVKKVDPAIGFLSAISGKDALALLSSISNSEQLPAYLFLDVNMPQMNGKDTLKEIRKNHRYNSIQIVMLSTSLNARDAEEYKQLGANHFMPKANSFPDLCEKLRSFLQDNSTNYENPTRRR
jgi:CheY-like chemotaxis protein